MQESLESLFRTDYMPHGHSYWWKPEILWLNVVSDVFIALAYFSIPVALYYFVKKRPGLEFKGIFILFSMFIFLCGITHLISIVVIWHGTYGIHGIAKFVTAIVSCITAIKVFQSIPEALNIPSTVELKQAFDQVASEKVARLELENQKAQDKLLRESTNTAHVGILVVDHQGIIQLANDALYQIFGYNKHELEGEHIDLLIPPELHDQHAALFADYMADPRANKHMAAGRSIQGLNKDNQLVPIEIVLNYQQDAQPPLIYVSILDISERMAQQSALQQSENITRSIIDALPLGLHTFEWTQQQLILTDFNPAAENILGIDHQGLIGRSIEQAFPDAHSSDSIDEYRCVAREGKTFVNRIKQYNDSNVSGTFLTHSFQSQPGKVTVLFQDITSQKRAENALQAKERFISRAFDSSITGVQVYNFKHSATEFINQSFSRITGYSKKQINAHDDEFSDYFIHPEDRAKMARHLEKIRYAIDETQTHEIEFRFLHRHGHWIWCRSQDTIFEKDNSGVVSFIRSFLDISQSKQLQDNLLELKNAAEKASNAKSEFLANMSHEIRTPMNAILGLTHIVLNLPLGDKQKEYLTKVERSSQSLLAILNDILDYSKLEAGKLEVLNEPFYLQKTIQHVVDLFTLMAEDKQLELIVVENCYHLPELLGDQHRINQILNNLVGNALKFTQHGYVKICVEVSINNTEVALQIDVIDTGIGIPANKVGLLFRSFTQADGSISRNFGGTGLGLSISRHLASLMGGSLEVQSEADKGSTFSLRLPLKLADSQQPDDYPVSDPMRTLLVDNSSVSAEATQQLLNQWQFEVKREPSLAAALQTIQSSMDAGAPVNLLLIDWPSVATQDAEGLTTLKQLKVNQPELYVLLLVTASARAHAEQRVEQQMCDQIVEKPLTSMRFIEVLTTLTGQQLKGLPLENLPSTLTAKSDQALQGVSILVVEDNPTNQLVAEELLAAIGAQVSIADNGKLASQMAAEHQFDLVLMDLQMPEMDGYTAAKLIRAIPGYAQRPIIAMSAAVMEQDIQRVKAAGMDDHIAKPIDVRVLLAQIRKHLKS